jgi:hypothetical protein
LRRLSHDKKDVGGQGAQVAEETDSGACDFDGGFPCLVCEFGGQVNREGDQIESGEDRRQVVFP